MKRPEFDLDHYVALWDLTNRQDARNCEWQQEGLHARPLAHGNFVPQESGCHQFNQWVLESLGELEGPRRAGGGNGGGDDRHGLTQPAGQRPFRALPPESSRPPRDRTRLAGSASRRVARSRPFVLSTVRRPDSVA